MKIGLLQCDDINELLQAEFGNYPEMFRSLFQQVDPSVQIHVYDVRKGEYPSSLTDCDAYLTTGSQHGLNDGLAWVEDLKEFVRTMYQFQTKFFGICFGHQLLAEALGGKVELSDKGWGVGMSTNKIIQQKDWMVPALEKEKLNIIVSHQDQVTKLPLHAELLASSDFCENYVIQVGDHMASIQGHPEFTPAYSSALMNIRRGRIPAEVITEAEQSLIQHQADNLVFTRWILQFFRA